MTPNCSSGPARPYVRSGVYWIYWYTLVYIGTRVICLDTSSELIANGLAPHREA